MNFEKMEAGPEMDYMIGIKIMKFNRHKWHIGGSCPRDAKVVNPKHAWGAHGVGGTYPYLLPSGTIFWAEKGYGDQWEPSRRISQAFVLAEETKLFSKTRFDRLHSNTYRISGFHKNGNEYIISTAPTAPLAICRAVLIGWEEKKVKAVS